MFVNVPMRYRGVFELNFDFFEVFTLPSARARARVRALEEAFFLKKRKLINIFKS